MENNALKLKFSSYANSDIIELRSKAGLTNEAYQTLDDIIKERKIDVQLVSKRQQEISRSQHRVDLESQTSFWSQHVRPFLFLRLNPFAIDPNNITPRSIHRAMYARIGLLISLILLLLVLIIRHPHV